MLRSRSQALRYLVPISVIALSAAATVGCAAVNALTAALVCYCIALAVLAALVLRQADAHDLVDPAFAFFALYLLLTAPGPVIHLAFGGRDATLAPLILFSLLLFCAGAELVRLIVGRDRFAALRRDFQKLPARPPHSPAAWTWAAALAGAAGTALAAGFYARIGTLPLLARDVEAARLAATTGAYLRQGFIALLPTAALALGAAGVVRRSRAVVAAALGWSAAAMALVLGTGYAHPAVQLAVAWVVLVPVLSGRRAEIVKTAGVLLALFVAAALYVWLRAEAWPLSPNEALPRLGDAILRLLYASTDHLARILAAFPRQIDFLWGGGYVMDFAALRPGPDLSFSHWFAARLSLTRPEWADMSIMGEFYANFGWAGVIMGMPALGAAARLLYVAFLRRPKTIARTLLLFLIAFTVARASHGGLGANLAGYLLPNALALGMIAGTARLLSRLKRFRQGESAAAP